MEPLAVDDRTPISPDLDPVPMPPDAGVGREIAFPVPATVSVSPKVDGHGGHGLGDDEFADLVDQGPAIRVEGLHPRTQPPALDDPTAYRQPWATQQEGGAEVSSATQG